MQKYAYLNIYLVLSKNYLLTRKKIPLRDWKKSRGAIRIIVQEM